MAKVTQRASTGQAADPPAEAPGAAGLSIERRVKRAFASQARASVVLSDFTEEELAAFAELVTPEGAFSIDIRDRFAELWLAHRARIKAAQQPPAGPVG